MAARINTWLTEAFGLDLPVVTASMAGVADGRFAAAACRAGILGTVGVGPSVSGGWVREQLTVAEAADRSYGVGLMAWAQAKCPDQFEAVLEARPHLVSVTFGDYAPYVEALRSAGITVATQVGSVARAVEARDAGVDVVIARGGEAGGHGYNLVATLPLLQGVLDSVDLPVLAAGGIGTARGLAAVLAAGAAGAWIGTAFTCCLESAFPDDEVARIGATADTGTAYGHIFDVASAVGWPADIGGRAIRNAYFDEWTGREEELPADPGALARFRAAPGRRDFDTMPTYIGQGVGLLDGERRPIADVVADLAGAADLLKNAAHSVSQR